MPLHTFEAAISILMAAIALVVISIYPNLQNAINRGKQRRMMSDMRSMGEAINAYHLDFGGYPPGKSTVEEIQKDLEGYMDKVPLQDEWGNKYLYRSDGSTYYTILSWGKDRVMDNTSIYQGLVTSYSNDIVFSNGLFVSFPEILE
ncbi:type II secretion system protein GspG [bacterium]|nr:type II secretion system protein GspG [bacterium]MCI0613535.1 type II secretion system protein GspG [bacterium]